MPPVECANHAGVDAIATCGVCLRPLCLVCMVSERLGFVCPTCLPGVRRRHRLKTLATIAGVLTVLVVGWKVLDYYQNGGAELGRLRRELDKQPCDRGKIIRLGDALLDKDQNREALQAAGDFFARCGPYPRLLWITRLANRNLGNFQASLADTTALIESEPRNRNYFAWRGLTYEEMRDWPRAIADFRQAITLEPKLIDIPFNLADAYERTGKPCEAIFPLEQVLFYHPDVSNRGEIRRRIEGLYESGQCGDFAGKGRAVVAFAPGADAIVATASLNGTLVRLLVDTGATSVAIGPALATRLGIVISEPPFMVDTANGPTSARPVILDSVAVQGASASRVNAVVMQHLPEGVDGLLGLSFLSRFDMKLDRQTGQLELSARNR
jgi:clan AA aspartic protease (TIGR02281 family)